MIFKVFKNNFVRFYSGLEYRFCANLMEIAHLVIALALGSHNNLHTLGYIEIFKTSWAHRFSTDILFVNTMIFSQYSICEKIKYSNQTIIVQCLYNNVVSIGLYLYYNSNCSSINKKKLRKSLTFPSKIILSSGYRP